MINIDNTPPDFVSRQGVVDVWFADLPSLALDRAHCYTLLDGAEQSMAAGMHNESLREQYIQGHGLLRALLGRYLRMPPETLKIGRTMRGKPFLVDFPGLSFNLSHSSSKWLLAITAHVPVGVDIEMIKSRTQLSGLVGRCFAPEEQAYWQSLSEEEQLPVFFDFWTRKEAFVKAVGQGIALGLDRCAINPDNLQSLIRIPDECGAVDSWCIKNIMIDDSCRAAVVAQSCDFHLKFYAVQTAWLNF